MLVREGNKIVCKNKMTEKVVKGKSVLLELAESIDSLLKSNKINGVIEFEYGDFLDCRLDIRSFGTKIKDILKGGALISEEDGFLNICDVYPMYDGYGVSKCRVSLQYSRSVSKKYKDIKWDDVPKFVLGVYKKAMEELDSKKEK